MTIAFVFWPANTEVQLIDDDGRVKANFYTACSRFGIGYGRAATERVDAEWLFGFFEEMMPDPIIAGEFSAHHPYWADRKARREARAIAEEDETE
jgi:hypothetical protein